MKQRPSLDEIFAQPAPIGKKRPSLDEIFAQAAPGESSNVLARTGRDIAGGLGSIADIGYLGVEPIYKGMRTGLSAMGVDLPAAQDTQKYAPSTAIKAVYDKLTNNSGLPQNNTAAIADKAAEMLAGGGIAGLASKAQGITNTGREALNFLSAPITKSGAASFAGAGAGSEFAKQQYPDSAIAPAIGTLAGGMVPNAASLGRVGKQLVQEGLSRGAASILPEISSEIQPIAQKALEYNIPISRTQIGDSQTAKTFASASAKVPFSGAGDFAKEQQKAFNREVLSTIGATNDKATPEILANSYRKISNQFDNALKGQEVRISDDMLAKLNEIDKNAAEKLTEDNYYIVKKQIDKFFKNLSENDTIQGEKLGDLRSDLSGMSKSGGGERRFIGQLKNFVQDVSVDGAPTRKEELKDAIEKFRHYQIIKPLLNKAVRGDLSPSLLLGRVASNYSDFAQGGGGKLGDLARIGQAFLKDPIPDSASAQRLMAYKALEGGGAALAGGAAGGLSGALGATVVPVGISRGFNSANTSQRLIRNTLGLPSGVKIPKEILKMPPAVALKAIQQLQEQNK